MKSAFVSAFKAFVSQLRENKFEMAKKTVMNNGYKVVKDEPKTEKKSK